MRLIKTQQSINQYKPQASKEIIPLPNHSLYMRNDIKANTYKLYIGNFVHESSELDGIIYDLENSTENDFLEISIHSYGGLVYELQRLENVIKNIFVDRTRTILNPMGYSAGGVLFLMGNERLCFENSQIMLHNASGGFIGKFSDIKTNYEFETEHLENYFKSIISKFLNKKEVRDFINGKEFWFDSVEMCKRNICTHVIKDGCVYSSKDYLELIGEIKPKVMKSEKPEKLEKLEKSQKPEKSKKEEILDESLKSQEIKEKETNSTKTSKSPNKKK